MRYRIFKPALQNQGLSKVDVGFCIVRRNPQRRQIMGNGLIEPPLSGQSIPHSGERPGIAWRFLHRIRPEGKVVFPDNISPMGSSGEYDQQQQQRRQLNMSQQILYYLW